MVERLTWALQAGQDDEGATVESHAPPASWPPDLVLARSGESVTVAALAAGGAAIVAPLGPAAAELPAPRYEPRWAPQGLAAVWPAITRARRSPSVGGEIGLVRDSAHGHIQP